MKRILGLDLGVSSIGWAVIECDDQEQAARIAGMGSRIIPLSVDDATQFTQGQAITKNAERTSARTQRKGYSRRAQRRAALVAYLTELGLMYGDEQKHLPAKALWGLRAQAAREQVTKPQLGRVLLHLNLRRGYRSGKADFADKKSTKYVGEINARYDLITAEHKTIGEYLYGQMLQDDTFRCKQVIFPRGAYKEEFDTIMACQQQFYPDILTDEVIARLRDTIIYYQRPLKSCKHLVSICELEKKTYLTPDGKSVESGPKVAPRTSPIAEVCKIWESINNITLHNRLNESYYLTLDEKRALFNHMNTHEKLTMTDINRILQFKKNTWFGSQSVGAGLQGNTTYTTIRKALGDWPDADKLLRFNINFTDTSLVDTETGEFIKAVDLAVEQEPYYRLWHTLYSIDNPVELDDVLLQKFDITDSEVRERLCHLDLRKAGYANKSVRAMRRILPYLMEGLHYSDACTVAGYRHSDYRTKEENEARELAIHIAPIKKNELRQPIVEKILNQMINVVNSLVDSEGAFDEIHIELARELKQSRDERASASSAIRKNEAENQKYADLLRENNYPPTRTRIQKYKMWNEAMGRCVYCYQSVNLQDFLNGFGVEVEHILPRSLYFDDSFSNKVCSCRRCNHEKNNRTAYDFMHSRGEAEFQAYLDRVNEWYKAKKISKTKWERLLTPAEKIPQDFIDRQLRESQYIARKARELLEDICRTVVATSGSVTDFVRHLWGWDQVLHDLNIDRYRLGGLTEMRPRENDANSLEERIVGWSKRMDHRHHAIDALAIACTKRSYIQRLNHLNTMRDVPFQGIEKQSLKLQQRHSALERYIISLQPFTTAEVREAASQIAVSFKAGKRVTTPGKRYIYKGRKRILAQSGLLVPRGPLSKESVYGRNMRMVKNRKGEWIKEPYYVLRYPLENITSEKDASYIVDAAIRKLVMERLATATDKKRPFAEPLRDHQGRVIRAVRCDAGLDAVTTLRRNEHGEAIAFVQPRNNHHVAIYEDSQGGLHEHIVTFWHAVERKKYGLPIIIEDTAAMWDSVTKAMPEEFKELLPEGHDWRLKMTLQQNEMFILGMPEEEYRYALEHQDQATLCRYLYRVQKMTKNDYVFRYHLETSVDDKYDGARNEKLSMSMGKFKRTQSLKALAALNPHKVRVTLLGQIVEI